MIDPNKFQFSDGYSTDNFREAQEELNKLMDDCRDFSVKINGDEIKFTQYGEYEDV